MISIDALGPAAVASPLALDSYVGEDQRVRREIELPAPPEAREPTSFEKAGPRARLFFDPRSTTVGIVAAGGLCPGINDVVRSAVLELHHRYGVPRILGFRFGLAALDPKTARDPIMLDPDVVRDIHMKSGSILGTSRGDRDPDVMVDSLLRHGVNALLAIGGDGTMRGAHAIYEAITRRRARIGVVGIPKTIDNDIPFVDKTFGFDTAVAAAHTAIDAAHAEARSIENGIGLVRLMGRSTGFIAAHATLASHDVNACLVPEVPFSVDRLLGWLDERLATRGHAVIVVAEGCAENIAELRGDAADRSGNRSFAATGSDVGPWLRDKIERHFARSGRPIGMKYIDPSYLLRGVRAKSEDALFCDALARNAVHAAMAGKTNVMVGRWHRVFTHVSLPLVLTEHKRIDRTGELWRQVLEATGQPQF